jgi:uncharacterized damage-inducible protein DinB
LFHSARWKAYLKRLQEDPVEGDGSGHKAIYHIYHSQKIWFTREEGDGHRNNAEDYLRQSDAALRDCAARISALEETLANTPRPSEVLDWGRLW